MLAIIFIPALAFHLLLVKSVGYPNCSVMTQEITRAWRLQENRFLAGVL